MKKLQESIEIIQRLIEKNKEQLNALDQELAKKHLLKLYEYFQTEWNKKTEKQEKIESNARLFSWDEEEELENEEVIEDRSNYLEENKTVEELDEESIEGDMEGFENLSNANLQNEQMDVEDAPSENIEIGIEKKEKEINDIEEPKEVTINKIHNSEALTSNHFSFEPPADHSEIKENFFKEWTPKSSLVEKEEKAEKEEEVIHLKDEEKTFNPLLTDNTKSTFIDVEKDLNLEKKKVYFKDIRNQIGINDRYLYSNELFKNKEAYEKALDIINDAEDEKEIWDSLNDLLLTNKENYNEEDEVFMSFKETIHQFLKLSS